MEAKICDPRKQALPVENLAPSTGRKDGLVGGVEFFTQLDSNGYGVLLRFPNIHKSSVADYRVVGEDEPQISLYAFDPIVMCSAHPLPQDEDNGDWTQMDAEAAGRMARAFAKIEKAWRSPAVRKIVAARKRWFAAVRAEKKGAILDS